MESSGMVFSPESANADSKRSESGSNLTSGELGGVSGSAPGSRRTFESVSSEPVSHRGNNSGDGGGPSGTAHQAAPAVEVSLRTLLEAGVHYGHQTSRWHPAMAPYIYGVRNGIHIINLPRTIQNWKLARQAILDVVSTGGNVLFVGTKKQAQEAIEQEAKRCGAFFISRRWLGGMITNFQTIRKSVDRMRKIEGILASEDKQEEKPAQGMITEVGHSETVGMGEGFEAIVQQEVVTRTQLRFTKKERLMMDRERTKLNFSLEGIREMNGIPQLLFVVDLKREEIAVKEAQRLDIPVVALVDTNCDPQTVTYPIPSNDDATRAIRIFAQAVADAVLEGKQIYAERRMKTGEGKEEHRGDFHASKRRQVRRSKSDKTPASKSASSGVEESGDVTTVDAGAETSEAGKAPAGSE